MEKGKYDDIINLPNPTPTCRPRMSALDRAAQFAPFAALTGYEAVVEEAARLTDEKKEISEDMKAVIDAKIQILSELLDEEPVVTITYFSPDTKKTGGAYVTVSGVVTHIDEVERCIAMAEHGNIFVEEIRDIDGEMFGCLE